MAVFMNLSIPLINCMERRMWMFVRDFQAASSRHEAPRTSLFDTGGCASASEQR